MFKSRLFKIDFLMISGGWFISLLADIFIIKPSSSLWKWPVSGYIVLFFLIFHFMIRIWKPLAIIRKHFLRSSTVVILISLLLLQSLIYGVWGDTRFIKQLIQSLPFIFSLVYICSSLLHATFNRIQTLSLANLSVTLIHLGLLIIIGLGSLSVADFQRLQVKINRLEYASHGIDQYKKEIPLPVRFKLEAFELENYPPQMIIVNKDLQLKHPQAKYPYIEKVGRQYLVNQKRVFLHRYYDRAIEHDGQYWPIDQQGASPSAFVTIDNQSGWLTSGSKWLTPKGILLDPESLLQLSFPKPKRMQAKLHVQKENQVDQRITVTVNQPMQVAGYYLYLISFDEKMGKYTDSVELELIYDPWLHVVFAGFFMIMLGSLLMIFTHKRN